MPISSKKPHLFEVKNTQENSVMVVFRSKINEWTEQDEFTNETYTLYEYEEFPLMLDARSNLQAYIEANLDALLEQAISEFKKIKIDELRKKCEEAIEFGFVSSMNQHFYRTNRDDQVNLIGKKDQVMNDATITEIYWKTEDAGYVAHTREEWLQIYFEGLEHKESQLFKLDVLRKRIYSMNEKKEIESVTW